MGRYHFIAIGGIGMSGLAKYLLEDGHTVSGSDIADSKYVEKLRDAKVIVNQDERKERILELTKAEADKLDGQCQA